MVYVGPRVRRFVHHQRQKKKKKSKVIGLGLLLLYNVSPRFKKVSLLFLCRVSVLDSSSFLSLP